MTFYIILIQDFKNEPLVNTGNSDTHSLNFNLLWTMRC